MTYQCKRLENSTMKTLIWSSRTWKRRALSAQAETMRISATEMILEKEISMLREDRL